MKLLIVGAALLSLVACSTLTDFALAVISPSKGGVSAEIVVGDKEQTLGTNQDVNAGTIGKVVGTYDNSVKATGAKEVTVNNINIPNWLLALLLFTDFLFLCLPTPTTMFNYIRKTYNEF